MVDVTREVAVERELEARSQSRLEPGATFPDHELTGHDRKKYQLSEVQGGDPMILILSRGHFCPKDFQQHKLLVDMYPQIAVSYTKIVTVSTSNLMETNEWRDSLGAQWLFLTDPQRKLQKELGIPARPSSSTRARSGPTAGASASPGATW